MTPLESRLKSHIRTHGPITLAEYMARCLYDAEHGYYRSGDPLGKKGDFTTAPEISQMFGEMVGVWMMEAWRKLGEPPAALLLELGPGRGTLMRDLLRAAKKLPAFYASLNVHLVEINATLREKQKQALAGETLPITWHEALPEFPPLPLLVIANEFFDALPIHQFRDGKERMVTLDEEGKLAWGWCHPDTKPKDHMSWTEAGYPSDSSASGLRMTVRETSPDSLAAMERLSRHIAKYGGALLAIDYGYTEGSGDTFQAVRNHKYADPLHYPGEADLTAHVDFSALGDVAREAGLQPHIATQGDWLHAMGIDARAMALSLRATEKQRKDIAVALHRLTAPEAMGTLFKCLVVEELCYAPNY